MELLIIFLVIAAFWGRNKPNTNYNPKNVMGDGAFSSDKQLQNAKGGKLKLR
jgi:hypothetical protein